MTEMTEMTKNAGLSTHVLDLTRGQPAAGMTIELWFAGAHVKTVVTNADGRTDAPLVDAESLAAGDYELIFHVGTYFGQDALFDRVPIRFVIHDITARYHVPLLCTPWAYSTYRGS
jgi:5-hydroxyisourate hydrolase